METNNEGDDSETDSPVVLVIDAGRCGSLIAKKLKSQGVRVILGGNHAKKLALIADSLGVHFVKVDATNAYDMAECIDHIEQQFGRVDGIAHCAKGILLNGIGIAHENE